MKHMLYVAFLLINVTYQHHSWI